MDIKISVEIEGKRYVELLNLGKDFNRNLLLTTISNFQSRAIIKVFIFYRDKKNLIREIEVKDIPSEEAEKPCINLYGSFDGKRILNLKVMLNGKPYTKTCVNIKRYLPKRKKTWILIPVTTILVFAVLIFTQKEAFFNKLSSIVTSGWILKEEKKAIQTVESIEISKEQNKILNNAKKETAKKITGLEKTFQKEAGKENAPVAIAFRKETIYFSPGSAVISLPGNEKLNLILKLLNENSDKDVTISGHCALYGTEKGRIKLSVIRANKVYRYLMDNGWGPKAKPKVLGFGGNKPVTTNPKVQHLNRRVVIEIGGTQ